MMDYSEFTRTSKEFYAKYIIFNELISREFFVIALIAIIFTAIGLYYYLRIILYIFYFKIKR